MKKVLLVDHSGRGHAFARLFVRTNPDVLVYYAPGCAAIPDDRVVSLPHLTLTDPAPLVRFALDEAVDFVFVANAAALAEDFAGQFAAAGVPVIGPDGTASRLESSKSFTKRLCERHGIPTADFAVFDDAEAALAHLDTVCGPVVVKADGLCGGNGSIVCDNAEQARSAVRRLMCDRPFGSAGDRVVIEERLDGKELLFFALVDGGGHAMLPMAADYPRAGDGNTGVICGGVGAFSPHPDETPELVGAFESQVLKPLLGALHSEDIDYVGVMYVGTMLVEGRFHLLEVNVRMGEPEAEVVLPRVKSDFYATCLAMLSGEVATVPPRVSAHDVFCDVVAFQGATRQVSNGKNKGWYRGWPEGRHGKHYSITGVDWPDSRRCEVYLGQATQLPDKGLVTDGGRCLHVVGRGGDLAEASRNAYEGAALVHFEGIRYRTDIGHVMPWVTAEQQSHDRGEPQT